MASPLSVATQPAFSPAQTLTEQEQKLQRMYGKLPQPKNLLGKLRSPDRKYFDSGDYALSKAGKINIPVGLKHPSPEAIPPHEPTPRKLRLDLAHQGVAAAAPNGVLGAQDPMRTKML